jgi:hypothetical protein
MGISEGEARGMLRDLEKRRMVITKPRIGTLLTSPGETRAARTLSALGIRRVSKLPQGALGVGPSNCIVHLHDRSNRVRFGVEQRDAAIKAGASGAITLTYDGRNLSFPNVGEKLSRWNPHANRVLTQELKLNRGDTILIAFSEEYEIALRAALASALTLQA